MVLVTSRALLRVSGEQVITVPPLTLPDPGSLPPVDGLDRFGAVRLFVDRAQAVHPAFVVDDENAADVVGDLPAARRAAAGDRAGGGPGHDPSPAGPARPAHPSPGAADRRRARPAGAPADPARRDRLELRPAVPGRAAPLPPPGGLRRRLHARPPSRPSAPTTGPPPSTSSPPWSTRACSSRSPRAAPSLGSRCWRPLREYALERLETGGEEVDARRAHAAYFRGLAEDAETGLRGPRQQHWRDVLEADLDNFRAALAWTLGGGRPARTPTAGCCSSGRSGTSGSSGA